MKILKLFMGTKIERRKKILKTIIMKLNDSIEVIESK